MSAAATQSLRAAYLGSLPELRRMQFIAGLSESDAADFCLVSPHTYRRWLRDRPPRPAMARLMAIRAGYLPWPGWEGWEVHNGLLFPPGFDRHGLGPEQVAGLPYLLHLTRHLSRPPVATSGPQDDHKGDHGPSRRGRWTFWRRTGSQ